MAGFFSKEAGQNRRQWLDSMLDYYIAKPANKYLGPTGLPGKVQSAGQALEFTDAGDMGAAAQASSNLWNNPSIGNAAEYAAAGAALALPMYSHKMGEGILSVADDLVKGYDPNTLGAFRVWHGSPHDFDKFSMDKIGTGEGAQAYGHGLYFAEHEDVARGYQQALAANGYNNTDNYSRALETGLSAAEFDNFEAIARQTIRDPDTLAKAFFDWNDDWAPLRNNPEEYEGIRKFAEDYLAGFPEGRLYEVAIDAEPEDFIDFDAPFSSQPKVVQNHFKHLARADTGPDGDELARRIESDIWRREAVRGGVKGIKYLDQGSRGAGDGTRNYVLFDDGLAHILSKNGQQQNTEQANRMRALLESYLLEAQ